MVCQPIEEILAMKDESIHPMIIALRFVSGDLMDDPLGVLRFGTSTMGTWDIPFDSKIKAADITR